MAYTEFSRTLIKALHSIVNRLRSADELFAGVGHLREENVTVPPKTVTFVERPVEGVEGQFVTVPKKTVTFVKRPVEGVEGQFVTMLQLFW